MTRFMRNWEWAKYNAMMDAREAELGFAVCREADIRFHWQEPETEEEREEKAFLKEVAEIEQSHRTSTLKGNHHLLEWEDEV